MMKFFYLYPNNLGVIALNQLKTPPYRKTIMKTLIAYSQAKWEKNTIRLSNISFIWVVSVKLCQNIYLIQTLP